jgi:hypothetical protein
MGTNIYEEAMGWLRISSEHQNYVENTLMVLVLMVYCELMIDFDLALVQPFPTFQSNEAEPDV